MVCNLRTHRFASSPLQRREAALDSESGCAPSAARSAPTLQLFNSSTLYYIAKPPNLRRSLGSETFDGQAVNYSYTIDTDGTGNYRTATGTGNAAGVTETHVMIPRYKPSSLDTNKDTIFAIATPATGVTAVDTSPNGKWLELKPSRVWAKQS